MTGLTDALALREISVLHHNCTSSRSFQTPKLKETLQGDLLSADLQGKETTARQWKVAANSKTPHKKPHETTAPKQG